MTKLSYTGLNTFMFSSQTPGTGGRVSKVKHKCYVKSFLNFETVVLEHEMITFYMYGTVDIYYMRLSALSQERIYDE